MVKLDIISDPVCPWCYIGKAMLDQACAERPDHPFTLQWHPYQLNPEMPAGGMDRATYLERKFGGKEAAVQAYLPIAEQAAQAGLTINFDVIERMPNTLDAHRLIHWAGIEDRQTPAAMALFRAYFEDGRDIGDHEVLADIADSVGMDAAVILKLLAADADTEDIRKRDSDFREMGITGVPTFIVAGQHAVPGCQPKDLWIKVIDEISGQLQGG
ncbi:DsbA family oxidoreductase [Roseovarius sp. SYSU LYC5161]|uniref:DsbA family oxidoreductase n=1 Tax=Roseovarius halophilus (ex Wu et al. 2025) TaxID=3376060 RepID=UPI002870B74C|nr:DsbA family oxidoreductase [Roseovarius sp.]